MSTVLKHVKRAAIYMIGTAVTVYPVTYFTLNNLFDFNDAQAHRSARIAALVVYMGLLMFYKWPGGLAIVTDDEEKPKGPS